MGQGETSKAERLIGKYTRDKSLVDDIFDAADRVFGEVEEWMKTATSSLNSAKRQQDMKVNDISEKEAILAKVAQLYGDRIAPQPPHDRIRNFTWEAVNYRFPNKIPPGFSDQNKATPREQAGDYLIWEEMIDYMKSSQSPRLLFVSDDTKEDWYEQDDNGHPVRPWPQLFEEMRTRAGVELRVETANAFFEGIEEFLGAHFAESTIDEIEQVPDSEPEEIQVLEDAHRSSRDEVSDEDLERVFDFLKELDRDGERFSRVIRRALVSSGSSENFQGWTGRRYDGFLIHRFITEEFDFAAGGVLDFLIDGIEVDLKVSRKSAWKFSVESVGALSLLVAIDDSQRKFSVGILRADSDLLTGVSNRDGRKSLLRASLSEVKWVIENADV
ncbi:NaeI family type II restriction endonuclease [Streptomyces sp. ME01-24h]|nr:NaeI family type II restriction endonuclease [Streptomyces sp. ME01-24h]